MKEKMLELLKDAKQLLKLYKSGQVNVLTMVVGIILLVAAALPVAQDVVTNSTATGTTRTLIDLIPLFVAISAIVFVARSSGMGS